MGDLKGWADDLALAGKRGANGRSPLQPRPVLPGPGQVSKRDEEFNAAKALDPARATVLSEIGAASRLNGFRLPPGRPSLV